MTSTTEKCRVCGQYKELMELPTTLYKTAKNNQTFKENLEKYSGIKYSSEASLPQRICNICIAELNLFILKSDQWKLNESRFRKRKESSKLKPPAEKTIKITPASEEIQKARLEKATASVAPPATREYNPAPLNSLVVKKSKISLVPKTSTFTLPVAKTSFQETRELFKLTEKHTSGIYDSAYKVDIDKSTLEEDGRIPGAWLEKNISNWTGWSDFVYTCEYCQMTIPGLMNLLSHLILHSGSKFPCTLCSQVFNTLSSYMNHTIEKHIEYLSSCCIGCKIIYHNIPALIDHYELMHKNITSLYICVDCGLYYSSFGYLKSHKISRHVEIQKTKEEQQQPMNMLHTDLKVLNSEAIFLPILPRTVEKRPRGRPKTTGEVKTKEVHSTMSLNASIANYHPRTHLDRDRSCYPCMEPGCGRVLVTKTGFEYHKWTHEGIKPFKCYYCESTFRSKHALKAHEDRIHL